MAARRRTGISTDGADEALGLGEAARELGLSYRRALDWVARGRLPARRLGREWLIRRADMEDFRSWWQERYARYRPAPR